MMINMHQPSIFRKISIKNVFHFVHYYKLTPNFSRAELCYFHLTFK